MTSAIPTLMSLLLLLLLQLCQNFTANSVPEVIEATNAWESSGYFEGDIRFPDDDSKNGLVNKSARWPRAIVPYEIEENQFDPAEIDMIHQSISEIENRTCARFVRRLPCHRSFVLIRSDSSGCWSYVGRQSLNSSQELNLERPKCVQHGIVIHELVHALGFYHQQSAADRDDFVTILWENIVEGQEHNFQKYDNATVTDFGVEYDYGSLMHYSERAFSKNGNRTIVPKKENVKIGQRNGLSDRDALKIDRMYKDECERRSNITTQIPCFDEIVSTVLPG